MTKQTMVFRTVRIWLKPTESKKAFLNAVEADRIEDVGLHPLRWRLVTATS